MKNVDPMNLPKIMRIQLIGYVQHAVENTVIQLINVRSAMNLAPIATMIEFLQDIIL